MTGEAPALSRVIAVLKRLGFSPGKRLGSIPRPGHALEQKCWQVVVDRTCAARPSQPRSGERNIAQGVEPWVSVTRSALQLERAGRPSKAAKRRKNIAQGVSPGYRWREAPSMERAARPGFSRSKFSKYNVRTFPILLEGHIPAPKAALEAIDNYRRAIEKDFVKGIATEHTYRPALKELLESLASGVDAVNEPKQIECGAPDFTVLQRGTRIGNVEAKDIGKPLDEVERDDQLKRYRSGLPNLVLTDYLEFRRYLRGEAQGEPVRIATPRGKKLLPGPNSDEDLWQLLTFFIQAENVFTIESPKELAERMAALARMMRDAIKKALNREDQAGTLHEQLKDFRRVLLHDLDPDKFADMYAQTICYGLFAARCNVKLGKALTRGDAPFYLPETNPFLRKMFVHIAGPELDERVVWAVEDLVHLLNKTAIHDILQDFGKRTRQEDPVVHFYETFLSAYDPKMREARGVYYTPEPVVSYIVRSVDHILKSEFGLADGLADSSKVAITKGTGKKAQKEEVHKVLVLDPAVGTGTFLHGVIDHIYEHQVANGQRGAWAQYVSESLLPRIFGFELLMAPYAVCHMKLGLQLKELGYDFKQKERLRVYLTNTLEEAHDATGLLAFAREIAEEANSASEVKRDLPIMVVLGNPPYSNYGKLNKSPWILGLLEDYKKDLHEKKLNLDDDFIKFIRFSQWRIEQSGVGILAFISNSTYIDGLTHRRMRQSLSSTFDKIFVLDLHGKLKKKQGMSAIGRDENVFDIQQGVAIGIFVKSGASVKTKSIQHAELWGEREAKYKILGSSDVSTTAWQQVTPSAPEHLFAPLRKRQANEFEALPSVQQIFQVSANAVKTERDSFCIHFTKQELLKLLSDFRTENPGYLRQKYDVPPDSRDWKLEKAIADLKENAAKGKLVPILYRPFDIRWTWYSGTSRGFIGTPAYPVMRHMLGRSNICLITTRQTADKFDALVTNLIAGHKSVAAYDINTAFPLWLDGDDQEKMFSDGRPPNLTLAFLHHAEQKMGLGAANPQVLFQYIYAILSCPGYRERYGDMLSRDFPRVPVTSDRDQFTTLSKLGEELISLHLLESPVLGDLSRRRFPESGTGEVGKGFPKYLAPGEPTPGSGKPLKAGRVYINSASGTLPDGQYFDNVPPEVWKFHIGGYQVCAKWLKDRRGRELSGDDITHYQKVVTALEETIRVMAEIDAAIPKWPIA
jgi:hypothetical protein